jgi:16S rRNA (cytosine1402-N4)-methyltransferase
VALQDEPQVHIPVLAGEAVEWLTRSLGATGPLVDCTVGAGGHAEAFLRHLPSLRLVGIDRDEEALKIARRRLHRFADRVRLEKGNFADLPEILGDHYGEVGAILYDLGVSSLQLDRPERGFGYRAGLALDMRMDRDSVLKASDIVNRYTESRLIDIIASYGEERFARRIGRAIVTARRKKPFEDAGELADVIKGAIPAATRRTGPHPARRTFQALRIETNEELKALEVSLPLAVKALRPGGRVAVISYHSLEDRIVKSTFRDLAQGCVCPPELPVCVCGKKPEVAVLTRRPVRPSEDEVRSNRRADSARMRVAEKLGEAA